jgi:hypothetical protein
MARGLSGFPWRKTMLIRTDPFELTGVPLKSRQNNFLEDLSQVIDKADRAEAV